MSFSSKLVVVTAVAAVATGSAAAGTGSSELDPWAQHLVAREAAAGPLDPWAQHLVAREAAAGPLDPWAQHLVARAEAAGTSPDDRAYYRGTAGAHSLPRATASGRADSFDWAAAGAGVGAGLTLALLAGGSAIVARRRRPAAL